MHTHTHARVHAYKDANAYVTNSLANVYVVSISCMHVDDVDTCVETQS